MHARNWGLSMPDAGREQFFKHRYEMAVMFVLFVAGILMTCYGREIGAKWISTVGMLLALGGLGGALFYT